MLDTHSEVSMAFDEMNLFEPFRKNTLDQYLNKPSVTAEQLTDLISQKKVYGTFWQEFERSGLQLDDVRNRLKENNILSEVSVIQTVLDLLREKNNAKIAGVKYPLHFRKVEYLLDHFPDSTVLFLTRNPKAIISSKLNDRATKKRKGKSFFHRFLVHYFTLFYFSLEYNSSVKKYIKYKDRLFLVTYEDIVTGMKATLENICSACDIPFQEKMLEASGKSSSYELNGTNFIHSKSISKYKETLSTFDTRLIELLTNHYFKKIEHESGPNI